MRLPHLAIIVGFGLLVVNSMARRHSRQSPKSLSPLLVWWLRYGDFVALGMVLAGMLRM